MESIYIVVLLLLVMSLGVVYLCHSRDNYVWSDNLFTRMNFVSPGYYTGSGLRYQKRPGTPTKLPPRNSWSRKMSRYYALTNAGDWTHDAANYSTI